MSQALTLKSKGIYSFPNNLSEVPSGALSAASNVVIDKESVVRPRRGMKLYGDAMGVSASTHAKQLLNYKGRIIRHWSTKLEWDNGSGTFTAFDDITGSDASITEVDSGLRIKAIEANGNFYFTTNEGIKKISANSAASLSTAVVEQAGVPLALDATVTGTDDPAGFLPDDSAVAYRIVWGIKDNNQNLILSAPSSRTIYQNVVGGASPQYTTISFPVPQGITEDYFYRIYRTRIVSPSTVDPGDEMFLVYEENPTSAEITAKLVTIDDETPEDFLGVPLYTNPNSGEGILQANEAIPLAKDIALFKGSTFLANTSTKHRKFVTMLGVSQLVAGTSQFIIKNGTTTETYTFEAAEDIPNKEVAISTAPTAAQKVDETARNLARVINRQSPGEFYARYLSGGSENELPGKLVIETRTVGDPQFELEVDDQATTGVSFSPTLPDSGSGYDELSDNEASPNRIYYSKTDQPEAVPSVNYLDIGPKDKAIIRILPLRDSLFVLKEDGVYRISGDGPFNFGAFLFDGTTAIKAPDSAAILNNQIFMASDQGVATVSDTGVNIVSRPIENLIVPLFINSNFSQNTFGVGYESDRAYLLFTIDTSVDTTATICYRYNTFTNTWTTWDMAKTCGIVSESDDKLYLAAADTNYIEMERKQYNRLDHADREESITIPLGSISGTNINLGSLFGIEAGDSIVQTQYLTISQYNRLLVKLDQDSGVADSNYYSLLSATAGDSLGDKLVALAAKLNADTDITDVDYTATGSTVFSTIQTEFNTIVNKLNADASVQFTNYKLSSGTVVYEVAVDAVDSFTSNITLDYAAPLIRGAALVFKKIATVVEWAPEHFGDPSSLKHVREATIIFNSISFSDAQAAYASDLSTGFVSIPFSGEGTGAWGQFNWGQSTWGGQGTHRPFRTIVPREKQRCRFIKSKYSHGRALEEYELYGVSYTIEPTSSRAYK